MEVRDLAGRIDRYPEVLTEVIDRGVNVIAVWTPARDVAAKKSHNEDSDRLPRCVPNPVEIGIVPSLTQPQGIITGIAWAASPEDVAKSLQLIHHVASRVASATPQPTSSVTASRMRWEVRNPRLQPFLGELAAIQSAMMAPGATIPEGWGQFRRLHAIHPLGATVVEVHPP